MMAGAPARRLDADFWSGRAVLVTGHMGFKGAWLCMLLARLGARTFGFGRDDRTPILYRDLAIPNHVGVEGDVNDVAALRRLLRESSAQTLLHLAAQPIVLDSYHDPLRTFADNVMGTAAALEAARQAPALKTIVVVTSDKVYRNDDAGRAFVEDDPLGGSDPYSASKAAAEILAAAMSASFFSGNGAARIATARAGNVIGGGDWAAHRLLPDAGRALARGEALVVRNPHSIRPWQHVLDPLEGYLMLAESMEGRNGSAIEAWNFGPNPEDARSTAQVADLFVKTWGGDARWIAQEQAGARKETRLLRVDSTRAHGTLGWTPRWRVEEAVARTAAWYRDHRAGAPAAALLDRDIEAFLAAS